MRMDARKYGDGREDVQARFQGGKGGLRLWGPWLLAGGGWALHILASFTLVDWYCHNDTGLAVFDIMLALHGLTLLSLALALAGVVLSTRNLKLLSLIERDENGNVLYSRSRFLALGGVIFSVYMSGIVLLEEWGNFVLLPCT